MVDSRQGQFNHLGLLAVKEELRLDTLHLLVLLAELGEALFDKGFRSGHEMRRLRNQHQLKNVCHLDGIVPHTFVESAKLVTKQGGNDAGPDEQVQVHKVQTIQEPWACPAPECEAVCFDGLELKLGWIGVCATFFVRNVTDWWCGLTHGGHPVLMPLSE